MKKNVTRFSCFLCILILPFLIVNFLYMQTNHYKYLYCSSEFLVDTNIPANLTVANLGSSHGQNGFLYPQELEKSSYNFGLPSQSISYDYEILDQYISHFKDDSVVIEPISFFSFYFQEDLQYISPRYYRVLDSKHILTYNFKDALLYKYFPVVSAGRGVFNIVKDISPLDTFSSKVADEEEIVEIGKKRADYHLKIIKTQDILETEKEAFFKLANLCKTNNLKLVVIIPPFSKYYLNNFSQEFYDKFYYDIENILKEFPEITFLDYSKAFSQTEDIQFFQDSDHLNKKGAERFTNLLLTELGIIKNRILS